MSKEKIHHRSKSVDTNIEENMNSSKYAENISPAGFKSVYLSMLIFRRY